MKICSASNLSNSNKNTCEQFNKYLKNKNKNLKSELSNKSKEVQKTESSLEGIQKQLSQITSQVEEKQKEISYLENTILNLKSTIEKKEQEIKDRMYSMQSYNNNNSFVDFIFGASNFTDIFSRIDSVNEITSYDDDLVKELFEEKKEIEEQKKTLQNAKKNLEEQEEKQKSLQQQYQTLLNKQQQEMKSTEDEIESTEKASSQLDKALEEFYENSKKDDIGHVSQIPNNPTSGNSSGNENNNSSTNTSNGIAIANAALSKQGCRYYWGATGPTYFDCSGLVYWAHNQAGVKIGRTTAAGYSRSGKSVTYSNLQVGDVITFNYGSGVAHIGIYIGNGQMVHASGKGSGTVGQYADQCVKVTSVAPGSYFYKYIYNCRRLY